MPEKPDPGSPKAHRGTLAVDDIHRQYEGEWVLLQVTAFDERQWPSRGKILCHSPDPKEVHEAVRPPRSQPGPLYIFFAEPRIRSGPEYVRAAEEFVARLNAALEADRGGMA
jgi:hypothetical protein